MKNYNILKIASKLLLTNKKQKFFSIILFTIIIFLVSIVLTFGINIHSSSKKTNLNYFSSNNIKIDYNNMLSAINENEIIEINHLINKYDIDILNIYSNFETIDIIDFNSSNIHVIEGENIQNKSGKNYVYLPVSFNEEYQINDLYNNVVGEFIVAGFIADSHNEIIDLQYFYAEKHVVNRLEIKISSDSQNYDNYKKFYKELVNLQKQYNYGDHFVSSTHLENLIKSDNIFAIILTCVIIFSISLLLISMFIVSNSILISYEQNYHSYSILKLLGAKNNEIWKLVLVDIIILGLVSCIIALIFYFSFFPLIESLVYEILHTICFIAFDGYTEYITLNISMNLHIYVIIFCLFVILMTVLIRRKMLKNINKSLIDMARSNPNE